VYLELSIGNCVWFARDGIAFYLEISFIRSGKVLEWQKNGFMSSKETVKEKFHCTLLIPSTKYGNPFRLFLGNILKLWDLVVLFLVVATCIYLVEEIH
jgi:hypothetical protein